MPRTRSRRTLLVAIIAVMAALHIILSIPPGPVGFRRLGIVMEPLEGILGGPLVGFAIGLVGAVGGRFARPETFYVDNLFGLAEAVGALCAGLLITRKGWIVSVIYGGMITLFLLNPFARQVPLWTLWDTYLGFFATFPTTVMLRKFDVKNVTSKTLLPVVTLVTFITVELDAMTRIFMLADLGLYQFYGLPSSAWSTIFIAGAFQTPVEAAYSVIVASVIGVPALMALKAARIIDWPLS
jgi:hypothetical protein